MFSFLFVYLVIFVYFCLFIKIQEIYTTILNNFCVNVALCKKSTLSAKILVMRFTTFYLVLLLLSNLWGKNWFNEYFLPLGYSKETLSAGIFGKCLWISLSFDCLCFPHSRYYGKVVLKFQILCKRYIFANEVFIF